LWVPCCVLGSDFVIGNFKVVRPDPRGGAEAFVAGDSSALDERQQASASQNGFGTVVITFSDESTGSRQVRAGVEGRRHQGGQLCAIMGAGAFVNGSIYL